MAISTHIASQYFHRSFASDQNSKAVSVLTNEISSPFSGVQSCTQTFQGAYLSIDFTYGMSFDTIAFIKTNLRTGSAMIVTLSFSSYVVSIESGFPTS